MNLFKSPACGNKHDPGLNGAEPALWNQNVSGCTVRYKLHRTQTTIKPPTCRQGLHSFSCVPNDLYTAPRSQQQEETVDVHTQHCPCKPSDA